MRFSYNFYYDDNVRPEAFAAIMIPVLIVSGIIALAVYICRSLALMKLAKNRGLNNPWISWIPFCGGYALGRISDDINLKKGKQSGHRKILLGMEISQSIVGFLTFSMMIGPWVTLLEATFSGRTDYMTEDEIFEMVMPMFGAIALLFVVLVLAVIYMVFNYIALYNLFKTYAPNNAVLFLVLSIFISYCQPIFLLVIQNKQPVAPLPPAGYYPNGYNPYPGYQPYQPGQSFQTYQPGQPYQNPQQPYQNQQPGQSFQGYQAASPQQPFFPQEQQNDQPAPQIPPQPPIQPPQDGGDQPQ